MKKAVVFDFDGTIADTFRVALDIFYEITGRGHIPHGEVDRLRSMPLLQAARALNLPLWKTPLLLSRGRKLLAQRMNQVELFSGMPEVLQQLKAEGYELHIISLNSEANIRKLLGMHGLEGLFTSIHGKARFRNKSHIVRGLMRRHDVQIGNLVYIGDETRDVHAAHKAKVRAVAVSWGYNNLHLLQQSQPDQLVLSPDEVPSAVKGLIG